ncbi:DUF3575 domain-containing protein [Pedobacter gandavensis]|uniref:DUF3575 domain-containing protein n=1 Tax=Pedobacter TaxID=84567 RepID=UPI001C99CF3C|nr:MULTISPECIES: DUF3575 domain-containing protein [Pedobacter]WGQ11272.1 DUF3575 domain-containing protein [Pedobacter gandavensis]
MKKTFTKTMLICGVAALSFSATNSFAQQTNTNQEEENTESKNLVKWNVAALALKTYSFQYERAVGKKISVSLGFRMMPKSHIPFSSTFKSLIDDDQTWESIKDFKTGNFAITPEFRYYVGQSVFRGFYVAPFVRYASYNVAVPYNYEATFSNGSGSTTVKDKIDMDGRINTLTTGLLLGAQWKLSKAIYLDWWILGPNYGSASGSISGKKTLNADEQKALREALTDLDDLPVVKTKSTVDGNGAKIDFSGPWAGVRSGLSIGYRF